jgi:hypothetical protein
VAPTPSPEKLKSRTKTKHGGRFLTTKDQQPRPLVTEDEKNLLIEAYTAALEEFGNGPNIYKKTAVQYNKFYLRNLMSNNIQFSTEPTLNPWPLELRFLPPRGG